MDVLCFLFDGCTWSLCPEVSAFALGMGLPLPTATFDAWLGLAGRLGRSPEPLRTRRLRKRAFCCGSGFTYALKHANKQAGQSANKTTCVKADKHVSKQERGEGGGR